MDIEQLIRENVQAVLSETASSEASTANHVAPAAAPITVNIQGKQVTFQNQADLEAQLNATAVSLSAERAALQSAPQPAAQGGRVRDDNETPSFSNDEFIKRMNEDPKTAINYALNHMMFDGQVDDAAALIRDTMINQAAQAKQISTYQFKDAYREVPLEDPRVNTVLEATRKELGLPFSDKGLEAAYIYSVGKGRLRAIAAQNQQQQHPQQSPQKYQQPPNSYLQGPPQTGRSGNSAAPVLVGDIEEMSVDQLGSLLNRLYSQGAG